MAISCDVDHHARTLERECERELEWGIIVIVRLFVMRGRGEREKECDMLILETRRLMTVPLTLFLLSMLLILLFLL